ncbi:hypothetical protein AB1L42_08795 [Thalassoglobus sp. JC818]|uniref:hypothetical protein n=1 Tax=Thalassoglobus sp. JC818 TaxID=3232136 RepID=UPI00345A0801
MWRRLVVRGYRVRTAATEGYKSENVHQIGFLREYGKGTSKRKNLDTVANGHLIALRDSSM